MQKHEIEAEVKLDMNNLSPFDDSLPARFLKQALDCRIEEAQLTTTRVYQDVVKDSDFNAIVPESGTEKLRLVVDASEDWLDSYADGTVKLAKEKGHLVAQIKNNGRYGSKMPIKEESYLDGASDLQVQMALQLQAISDALVTISEQIHAIDRSVKEVISGQHNDRLGLYYSGVSLFLEAQSVADPLFKNDLLSQAMKALNDAIFQLTLTMQSDMHYLKNKEYESDKKHKFDLINERMDKINSSFMAIHQASIMKAAIYCSKGEINAMTTAFREYEYFIENTIKRNAKMLSLCDPNANGKLARTWEKRAELQLGVSSALKQLQNPDKTIMFIENKESNENESF